jgi:hypothetical protein
VRATATAPARAEVELAPAAGEARPFWWVVRARYGALWTTDVLPGTHTRVAPAAPATRGAPDVILVSGVDRAGREGPAATATR